ncbi:hypothetical protein CC86DRAFT_413133 [Ophiobolus disseminans]|uniref:Uncharacterized protein n=1 Tax=Ophiobolus disseminans TaxID=1469910 RepID=A0A6A6ZGQ7_9PLEO|nr:hypothetical protein CC86DRAFT_413133 [Ophiobolus disseminans]
MDPVPNPLTHIYAVILSKRTQENFNSVPFKLPTAYSNGISIPQDSPLLVFDNATSRLDIVSVPGCDRGGKQPNMMHFALQNERDEDGQANAWIVSWAENKVDAGWVMAQDTFNGGKSVLEQGWNWQKSEDGYFTGGFHAITLMYYMIVEVAIIVGK